MLGPATLLALLGVLGDAGLARAGHLGRPSVAAPLPRGADAGGPAEVERALRVTQGPRGLSVVARATPFSDLLREISRVTGIAVYLEAALDPAAVRAPVDVTFTDVPVDEALKRVLRNKSFVVGYRGNRIDQVKIFDIGTGPFNRLTPLPDRGTAARLRSRFPDPAAAAAGPADPDLATLETTALSHSDPAERLRAVSELTGVDDEARAAEVALAVLERDPDPDVLEEALNVLEFQDTVPVDRVLRFASSGDRPARLRLQALEMLGNQGVTDPAFRRVVQTLVTHQDEEVRERAQQILEDLDDAAAEARPRRRR
jgi:hypothetical protein